jgi:hypothetical protein
MMTTQAPLSSDQPSFDESQLLAIEREATPLTPQVSVELCQRIRELRGALEGAVAVLDGAGYSLDAYYALDEAQRESPTWKAVRRAREACGAWPEFVMRYARGGQELSRSYPSRQAALDGAIEVLEMREGYPSAIETQGRHLMDCNAILRAWEDRHDPG